MNDTYTYQEAIITRRDLFAAFAMMGVLANPTTVSATPEEITTASFTIADAMEKEASKRGQDYLAGNSEKV